MLSGSRTITIIIGSFLSLKRNLKSRSLGINIVNDKSILLILIGLLLVGCQTHSGPKLKTIDINGRTYFKEDISK